MAIPSSNDPKVRQLVTGELVPENIEFFALKMILGRLSRAYTNSPTQETVDKGISELMEFFHKISTLPKAQKDLTHIFG